MNRVELTGRLTKGPETRYTAGENSTAVARFTLACDRRSRQEGQQTADFISCVTFGKSAEFIEKYFKKGMKMELCGRIQTGSYTNKDGVKVYTTEVVADEVAFAESKGSGSATAEPEAAPAGGFMDMAIDETLPFN